MKPVVKDYTEMCIKSTLWKYVQIKLWGFLNNRNTKYNYWRSLIYRLQEALVNEWFGFAVSC